MARADRSRSVGRVSGRTDEFSVFRVLPWPRAAGRFRFAILLSEQYVLYVFR